MFSAHRSCLCSCMRWITFFLVLDFLLMLLSYQTDERVREINTTYKCVCYVSSRRSSLTATQLPTIGKKVSKKIEYYRGKERQRRQHVKGDIMIISVQKLKKLHRLIGRARAQNKHVHTITHLFVSILFETIWIFESYLSLLFLLIKLFRKKVYLWCLCDDKKVCYNEILYILLNAFSSLWIERNGKRSCWHVHTLCTIASSCIAFKYHVMCQRLNDIDTIRYEIQKMTYLSNQTLNFRCKTGSPFNRFPFDFKIPYHKKMFFFWCCWNFIVYYLHFYLNVEYTLSVYKK